MHYCITSASAESLACCIDFSAHKLGSAGLGWPTWRRLASLLYLHGNGGSVSSLGLHRWDLRLQMTLPKQASIGPHTPTCPLANNTHKSHTWQVTTCTAEVPGSFRLSRPRVNPLICDQIPPPLFNICTGQDMRLSPSDQHFFRGGSVSLLPTTTTVKVRVLKVWNACVWQLYDISLMSGVV